MTRREREKKAKEGGRMEIERGGEKRRDMNKGVEKSRRRKRKETHEVHQSEMVCQWKSEIWFEIKL